MKYLKTLLIRSLALSVVISLGASCSNFLDEDLETKRNTDHFSTAQGIKDLAAGMYYNLRFHFAYEWSFAHTNYGTDEFRVGGDASNSMWNNYDANLGPAIPVVNVNTVMANNLWDNMYIGINSANVLLKNIETVLPEGTERNTYTGEAYFLRAFNYLKLVQQFGGVPLKLTPSVGPEFEFVRASAEAITEQVITDFTNAYNLLPTTGSTIGKMTKDAAAHFLAKAYLFRASEINDSWNASTKKQDLVNGLQFADEVISHRTLAPNFADLWNFTGVNGPNEQLNEIIFAAQFSGDASTKGTLGNQTHLYFLSVYRTFAGLTRDIATGREYQRLRNNYYAYDVYDRVNDSRFWKSFKTKMGVNNPTTAPGSVKGDLALMFIINNASDARYPNRASLNTIVDPITGKVIPTVRATYVGGIRDLDAAADISMYPSLSKYLDGSRTAVIDNIGNRDGILARLADTYLVAAEIKIRQDKYAEALPYINAVRNRAAYKGGEDRSAYTDGGAAYLPTGAIGDVTSYYKKNSYYESNNMTATTAATDLSITSFATLPAEDEAIITKLGYSDAYDRALCFLLNERSRELMGEFYRWEDLSRTMTLVERTKAYNDGAAPNIAERHNLRAIPQVHLDLIRKSGSPLTPEEKQAEQNPGY